MNLREIVDKSCCIGCGACCAVREGGVKIDLDAHGQYKPSIPDKVNPGATAHEEALRICPFSDEGPNEDDLGQELYAATAQHNSMLGYFSDLWMGHVRSEGIREIATSGGVVTWVLCRLLKSGAIDGVIHVKPVDKPTDGVLFRYGISRSVDEVRAAAKSRYYPVETSEVIEHVRETPGRYAFVGVPCFVKAIRRLCRVDPAFGASIRFTVGLVCGHLKSKAFGDLFGWQVGIAPGQLKRIDFRVKRKDGDSQDYAVAIAGPGVDVVRPAKSFFGTNWGFNFFRNSACDYCDDVFAESADLAVGDAWLPEFRRDPGGNSVVVVRHPELCAILRSGIQEGELALAPAGVEQAVGSQSGGFRDRREALAYRLWLDLRAGQLVPRKRVTPTRGNFQLHRRLIYRNRISLRQKSHTQWRRAVQLNSLWYFRVTMAPWMLINNLCYKYPAVLRASIVRFLSKKRGASGPN